ncbi:Lysophospholipase L1 [Ectothiorhodosinus mongolicus]|uniref:Lysophospholipase L1 n=1 Tax=Ectothiorhodosinus mongolicus TaxID=233100 RepID=A0A1R3W4Z5_9GAMM|nr:GDSL-type esterase/lipase family protein [Ectothiorhodosinus mongolicus]ULX57580.1 GDSL family lipase [Ectothiorhodosinus mongolicus]SIT72917.1 Lysophospholipase L1 [Ectothiorhodosinus mongolicus]
MPGIAFRSLTLGALALTLVPLVLVQAGCTAWRLGEAAQLSRSSVALQHHPENPTLRLLLVGDSTGVGTGADSPQGSVAGYLAADYPLLHIDNRARDGARFAQVVQQLAAQESAGQRYDLVLIMAGGNDVIRGTRAELLTRQIDTTLAIAGRLAAEVVVLPPGNVGNAPFFFAPLRGVMTRRSENFHVLMETLTEQHSVGYVRLFLSREEDPFVTDVDLNAADGLHPSAAGYALWYQELLDQTQWRERLSPAAL